MKRMKKIFALALTVIMVLGLATTAFAADTENTVEISVVSSASGTPVTGHTYEVYQIFTGTVATDGKTLSDIVIGKNVEGRTVNDVMALLEGKSDAEAAAALKTIITGTYVAELNDGNNHKANVVPGYYLIEDVTEDLPENETKSAFILQVLEAVQIKSKHTAGPIVEKKIDDKNDSNTAEDEIVWHDSADHDIGDLIDFQITTTIPSAFQLFVDNNAAYPYTLHDTEEAGLTFQPETVEVKIGETVLTKDVDYSVVSPTEDGHTFDIVFEDLTKVEGAVVDAQIVVTYKSILNENAVLGSKGNVNEVFGEFRNYYEPTKPVYTPKDAVIAFTYKVVINKVDEDKKPLPGAVFTLEKFEASQEGTVEYPKNSGVKGEWVAKETVETEPDTTFTFKGLDDGYYRLTENTAPDGYNKIAPIEFTVTAEHEIVWETVDRLDVLETLTGDVTTGEIVFTAIDEVINEKVESENIGLSADVENRSGSILPETGGIGTTIFYVAGALLAVVAVVLLVTKKRMSSAE